MSGRDGFDDHLDHFDDLDEFFNRRAPRAARPTRATRATPAARPARPARPSGSVLTARPPRPRPAAAARPRGATGPVRPAAPRRPATDRRRPTATPRPPVGLPLDADLVTRRTRLRLAGFVVAVLLVGAGISVRLADVQLGGGACRTESVTDCRSYGAGQRRAFRELPAARGAIFDRNGNALALSVSEPDVVADPTVIGDAEAVAAALAPVVHVDRDTLLAKLSATGTRYQHLAGPVGPEVEAQVRELDLVGISLEDRSVRKYPSGDLARPVVGRTYGDGDVDAEGRQGLSGLELAHDDELRGTPGKLSFERDPDGGTIAGTRERLEAADPGTDLYLTIDQSLQYAAERAVAEQVAATGAAQGMAVISRPSTGEILAMVSVKADAEGNVGNTKVNETVTSAFEPGSVNKMITIAGAMEEGIVGPDTVSSVPDHLEVADHTFTDHDPHPTQAWSTTDVLVTSSNVGTIQIAKQLGEGEVDRYLRSFGFGSRTGTELQGESPGVLLPLDRWSGTSIGSIPIGQGISVTALQMLSAYNVIANDGVLVTPKVVAARDSGTGRRATDPADRRRVVSAETAQAMSGMLQKVVSDGTGENAAVPGYPVAGKTGTARIPQEGPHADPDDAYQDAQGRYHYESGFVGFVAGADVSIIVTIRDAQTSIFGGEVAAPVFAELASRVLISERIPPPALRGAEAAVPDLSATARTVDGEDPGLVTRTTQG